MLYCFCLCCSRRTCIYSLQRQQKEITTYKHHRYEYLLVFMN
nr:MAG TPA: Hepatitis E virus ORF-2 (Putative capsid protein) [Caudoviricetes sp.]